MCCPCWFDHLAFQVPGWTGLSNARVTIFGDIYPLPEDQQVDAFILYIVIKVFIPEIIVFFQI